MRIEKGDKLAAAVLVTLATATTPLLALAADAIRLPFQATLQTTSKLILPVIPDGTPSPPPNPEYWDNADFVSRCDGAPVLDVRGAGNATLLGALFDSQVHCVGLPQPAGDGVKIPFFNGEFTFTDGLGRTITGRYFGQLVSTITSHLPGGPTDAPTGSWLVEGNLCISGGNYARIVDDCAANRYAPARGITNLSTGDAAIFIDQTIRFR